MGDHIDEIIEKLCPPRLWRDGENYSLLRAAVEEGIKYGRESLTDGQICEAMLRRGHIKISYDEIEEEGE